MTNDLSGFNDCHLTEKLQEVHGLALSRRHRTPDSTGAGAARPAPPPRRRSTGPAAPRPAWARSCSARRQPLRLVRGPRPRALCMGHRRRHLAPAGPPLSPRPKIFTATRPSSASITTHYGVPVALYGDRLNLFRRNDATGHSGNSCRRASPPPISAACSKGSASASSPPAPPRPRAASSACGAPCRTASSANCGWRAQTREQANAFLPEFLAPSFGASPVRPRGPRPRGGRRPASSRDPRLSLHRRVAATTPCGWGPLTEAHARRARPSVLGRLRVELRELLDGRVLVDYQRRRLVTDPPPSADFVLVPRRAQRLRASQEPF